MRIVVPAVTVLGGLLIVATAHAQSSKLPGSVASDLKALVAQCVEVGGQAQTADAVQRADLNGDGREDFVLDVGSINCDGAASLYGDRDKGLTVYVGDGQGGAKIAFTDSVYGARIEETGPAAKLWLTVSGAHCGKKPSTDFANENFCDRSLIWNAKTQKFDYAPVSTAKMIQ